MLSQPTPIGVAAFTYQVSSVLRALFTPAQKPAVRGVHLYFAGTRFIVAATHQNPAGLYYEQAEPLVIEALNTGAELGSAFRRAFDAFSVKDEHLQYSKKTEWPAFQASRLRSVKEFERLYKTVLCYGLTTSNAVVRATIAHPTHAGIELSVSFNPLLAPEVIGESLLLLVEASVAT